MYCIPARKDMSQKTKMMYETLPRQRCRQSLFGSGQEMTGQKFVYEKENSHGIGWLIELTGTLLLFSAHLKLVKI